MIATMGNP